MSKKMSTWLRHGEHWIWLNAGTVVINIFMVIGLLLVIIVKGMGHFWPTTVESFVYENDGKIETIVGSIVEDSLFADADDNNASQRRRLFIKTANRKINGFDFRWLWYDQIQSRQVPEDIIVLERIEWGDFYGYFEGLVQNGKEYKGEEGWQKFINVQEESTKLSEKVYEIRKYEIGAINAAIEELRLQKRRYELEGEDTPENLLLLNKQRQKLDNQYQQLLDSMDAMALDFEQFGVANFRVADGQKIGIKVSDVVSMHMPNKMNLFEQIGHYFWSLWSFLSGEPREANTEGGIFPAIFGTVMMVFLMTLITTPFGVIAAVYLREYAKQGFIVRLIRISVNNLAGVPSIVYGVFGLGFFVYFLGGNIDKWFYPEALPAPTFGSPGLLWASATLALLTLPVVIVSTEEGLARIPRSLREGSLALGATRFETIRNIIIPMASPAIMTGVILAIARAAGEVAPLMLVGVVKLAPDLVVDSVAPFVHLERKFMHLGFHIFDLGFQSPNVDASRPLVFATSLLLIVVIIVLNLAAIWIRNNLREKYKQLDNH